mmetsp:Transcript_101941/g.263467  ORF Transcript_101941/g.263467 Transcript_101941/m.263467 type:complete len:557 (-) Transcript_101941:116-1786(-)
MACPAGAGVDGPPEQGPSAPGDEQQEPLKTVDEDDKPADEQQPGDQPKAAKELQAEGAVQRPTAPPLLPALKPKPGAAEGTQVEVANCISTETGADSTCATSTHSVVSFSDQKLTALLKVSPPMPVGRVAGRYMVRLWRSSTAMPYGMTFISGPAGGSNVVVAEDAPHLGLRRGDELLSINGKTIESVRKCGEVLASAKDLELLMYHRETVQGGGEVRVICGSTCLEPYDLPTCCDACFSPPEPRCRARCFPLRDVLLSSHPVPADQDQPGIFAIQIVRISRKQTFGLAFSPTVIAYDPAAMQTSESSVVPTPSPASSTAQLRVTLPTPGDQQLAPTNPACRTLPPPSEDEQRALLNDDGRSLDTESIMTGVRGVGGAAPSNIEDVAAASAAASPVSTDRSNLDTAPGQLLTVSRDLPHLGLHEGDQLLRVNGTPIHSLDACKAVLKGSMTVTLELRRPGGIFIRRSSEADAASTCHSKDFHIIPAHSAARCDGSSAMTDLLQWLGVRLCCVGGDTGAIDDKTGADFDMNDARRTSLDVSRSREEQQGSSYAAQPV